MRERPNLGRLGKQGIVVKSRNKAMTYFPGLALYYNVNISHEQIILGISPYPLFPDNWRTHGSSGEIDIQ